MQTKSIFNLLPILGIVLLTLNVGLWTLTSFSQGVWVPKTSLPAGGITAVAFAIGGFGYLGTGTGGFGNSFWQYDPVADTWTQKLSCGGGTRAFATGFSIGNYGYIGMGQGNCSPSCGDFWRYNPVLNSWTQMASYGGSAPGGSTASFAMNGKGYIADVRTLLDFWEYDTLTNGWTKKSNFPGSQRVDLDRASFTVENKGYWGTGMWNQVSLNDFWEYDSATDTWTQKVNVPGTGRVGAVGFSICNKGFIGFGWDYPAGAKLNDLWMYDPGSNSWSACTALPAVGRYDLPSFVINNKAYLGTGWPNLNDWWEYTPDPNICKLGVTVSSQNILCSNQCTGTGSATPSNGISPYTYLWSPSGGANATATGLCAGTYSVIVTDASGTTTNTTVVITQPLAITFTASSTSTPGGTATVDPSGGTSPYIYLWNTTPPQTTQTATGLVAGVYCCAITDANNCTDTACVTVTIEPIDCSNAGELYLPNAFSPNNDGENDKLQIYYGNIKCIKTFNLVIYNRWGEIVFETTTPIVQWNGSYPEGTPSSKGKLENTAVFVYYLDAILISGEQITKKGNVSLMR